MFLFSIVKRATTELISKRPHKKSILTGRTALMAFEMEFQDEIMEYGEDLTPNKPTSILTEFHTARAQGETAENERLRLEGLKVRGTKGMKIIKLDKDNVILCLSPEEEEIVHNEGLNIYLTYK